MTTSEIHGRLIDLAALAELLSSEIMNRRVHPGDRNKADLVGVSGLLARDLVKLRDATEAGA